MHIKTGDLRPDSHADDDPSKLVKYAEVEGFKVFNAPAPKTEPIYPKNDLLVKQQPESGKHND